MAKVQRITQLTLEAFGEAVREADANAPQAMTPEEVRQRSLAARTIYEANEVPDYAEVYHRLLNAGWPWRIALFVAWSTAPKNRRTPKTQEELATQYLGLSSDRRISEWRRKYPAIDQMIADLQAEALLEYRAEALRTLGKLAAEPTYRTHNDRRLFFQMTGDFTPKQEVDVTAFGKAVDLSELSEEELAKLSAAETMRRLTDQADEAKSDG